MKRIIYIAVVLMGILPFFGKELQSSCFAQSMSSESLWDKADETGEYLSINCDYCYKFIGGTSKEDANRNMRNHVWLDHYEQINNGDNSSGDDSSGDDSSDDDTSTGSGGNSSYSSYYNVINIEEAAKIAQMIGIDNKQNFINYYNWYGYGYITNNIVYLFDFINFICNKYGATSFDNLGIVKLHYDKYFVFSKYYNSDNYCYYRIFTKYDSINYSNSYEFIYVFD